VTPPPTATSNRPQGRSSSLKIQADSPTTSAARQPVPAMPTHQRYNPLQGEAQLSSFTIPLERTWHHLVLTDTIYQQELQTLSTSHPVLQANPALHTMVARLFHGQENRPPLLVAWPVDRANNTGLIAYVIPRRDLNLQRYLHTVEAALSMQPLVAVQEATLRYDLHPDVPVGYLHYRLIAQDRSTADGLADGLDYAGYHYVLFNQEATELLLLTFVVSGQVESGLAPAMPNMENRPPPFASLIEQIWRAPAPSK